ncbi:hypothetical protein AB4Z51_24410 [Bradyrhizobium sp. 2TAF36]|uniref:hypothetical protein n=1 Tax=Bradyrhizobium sp. 2TAF36 TaxID=3233016 RepID=UPI003F8E2EF3
MPFVFDPSRPELEFCVGPTRQLEELLRLSFVNCPVDVINQSGAGNTIRPEVQPKGENVVAVMEALQSVCREAVPAKVAKPAKKPRPTWDKRVNRTFR